MISNINREPLYRQKLCDLPLRNPQRTLTALKFEITQELLSKGILLNFHIYISDEWFCPDGVPGVAVPFYIFSPELMNIEKREMVKVEGYNFKDQMRILRHEIGHCIDNAFRLRKDSERINIFGDPRTPYPKSYSPKKYSKSYISYLGDQYGQSHPDEDFAETFAAWLDPKWKLPKVQENSIAHDKLRFLSKLMKTIQGKEQFLTNHYQIDPLKTLRYTLKAHYSKKKRRHGENHLKKLDHDLQRQYPLSPSAANAHSLAKYLIREKKTLSRKIAKKIGVHSYQIEFAIEKTIFRAKIQQSAGTIVQLRSTAPLLVERNYRYLHERRLLRHFL